MTVIGLSLRCLTHIKPLLSILYLLNDIGTMHSLGDGVNVRQPGLQGPFEDPRSVRFNSYQHRFHDRPKIEGSSTGPC